MLEARSQSGDEFNLGAVLNETVSLDFATNEQHAGCSGSFSSGVGHNQVTFGDVQKIGGKVEGGSAVDVTSASGDVDISADSSNVTIQETSFGNKTIRAIKSIINISILDRNINASYERWRGGNGEYEICDLDEQGLVIDENECTYL